jgi:hypothetical protein
MDKMSSAWQPEEYSEEELISLDRLTRAVVNRVRRRAAAIMGEGEEFMLGREKTYQIINEEWARAKDAVKSSTIARANLQKEWDSYVDTEVSKLVKSNKDELSSMGVLEKSI